MNYSEASLPETQPPQSPGASPSSTHKQARPVVTYVYIALCVLIYLGQIASEYFFDYDLPMVLGAKVNEWILEGQVWRLFTPMVLHGSALHIAFNMYALYSIGRGLESAYGSGRFLLLILVSGFAGNVISFLASPAPSLGSSTAIFGLLSAEGIYLYLNKDLFGNRAKQALFQILQVAVINLLIGFSPNSRIDNWGHIGGMLGGLIFSWFAGPAYRVTGNYPSFVLSDKRGWRETWLAAAGVGAVFALLAAVIVVVRSG